MNQPRAWRKRTTAAAAELNSMTVPQISPAGCPARNGEERRVSPHADRTKFRCVVLDKALQAALRFWRWIQLRRQVQLASKRLWVCETASLGEKRFVAIVKADGQCFLVGGSGSSVGLLAPLSGYSEFGDVLQHTHLREHLPI